MLSRYGAFVGLLIVATAAGVQAQSLAEVAQKEKERRAKLQGARPAKPITEEDLAAAAGTVSNPAATDTAEPSADVSPSSSRTVTAAADGGSRSSSAPSGAGEAYWRNRATQLRAAVASAEARLKAVEERAAKLGPPMPGPRDAPCQAGALVGYGETAIELRDKSRRTRVCNTQGMRAQEQDRVYADVTRARADLDRAKAALAALDDEARRGGAMPGWIR
jgi:hypothetical protein